MTKDQVIEIMKMIAIEKGARFQVSPERITSWAATLAHMDFKHARKGVERILLNSSCEEWPPEIGDVLREAKAVAYEWAVERRREFEAEQKAKEPKEIPLCQLSPEEAEAGRQRGLSILRDCIAKMEAKKAGVK